MKKLGQSVEQLKENFKALMADENAKQEDQLTAMENYFNAISEDKASQIQAEYEELKHITDSSILASRGVHTLTSKEIEYYNEVTKAEGLNVDTIMPETIIERVFEGIVEERPLLKLINFLPYAGKNKIIRGRRVGKAVWGPLHRDLEGELDAEFGTTANTIHSLTAFFIISNDTLDLGPKWVDRFVRLCLQEVTAEALEEAVVTGTGNNQPIGLTKDLDGAVVSGNYPDKTSAGTLTLANPETMIEEFTSLLKDFTEYTDKIDSSDTGVVKYRNVDGKLKLLVHPSNYLDITARAMTMNLDGNYVKSLPHIRVEDIEQSVFAPKDKVIAFLPKEYDASISHNNRIYVYKETLAMSRATLYAVDMFADGRPMNNEMSRVYDLQLEEPVVGG